MDSMLFPSQCVSDAGDSAQINLQSDARQKPKIFSFNENDLDNRSNLNLNYENSEPFQNQFEENGSNESSFDSAMYSVEEAKLLCQRNRHYCNESLMKKFKRLVRVDSAELYFTPLIVMENISDEVGCQKNVEAFVNYLESRAWPAYKEFHEVTMMNTRPMSRSL